MDKKILGMIKEFVGEEYVTDNPEIVKGYIYDETALPVRPRAANNIILVKPANTVEISEILKLANKEKIPVFPRGGGTGLVGAAIPTIDGIVLSLERLDNIEIDKDNLMAIAEAGVTLRKLLDEAEKAGLFFPAHPGDESAQIGGLVACNAGGSRAVKTGVMRNYIRGLEVVLPTGEVLSLGGKLIKDNAGYDLMQLFIGSEGTLGIITKAIIRLYPKSKFMATLVVPYNNREEAFKTVPKILQSGIIPLAIEYVERKLVERTAKSLGMKWPASEGEYFLMIIVSEQSENSLYEVLERLAEICTSNGSLEPLIADTRREQDSILKIRSEIYTFLKSESIDILDVTVPPANVLDLIKGIERMAKEYGIEIPLYGHVADGNLHPHILRVDGWSMEKYKEIIGKIYSEAIRLGGTITGEHGIGVIRKEYLLKFKSAKEIELMRELKRLFDPNNILNPDKVIP